MGDTSEENPQTLVGPEEEATYPAETTSHSQETSAAEDYCSPCKQVQQQNAEIVETYSQKLASQTEESHCQNKQPQVKA